jgi:hypothetical protein
MDDENKQNRNVILIHPLIGVVPSFLIGGRNSPLGEMLVAAEDARQKAEESAAEALKLVETERKRQASGFADLEGEGTLFIDELMPDLSLTKRPNYKGLRSRAEGSGKDKK